jgi:hypothetical protein
VDDPAVDLVAFERDKIRGAIRTDLILSAEIVVIALGTVADAPFLTRVAVLVGIAAIMTVGVYGLVAGIVKLDDLGLTLSKKTGPRRAIGKGILLAAPTFMKLLSIAGTAAMFLVGGGILTHGIPPVHHAIESVAATVGTVAGIGGVLAAVVPALINGVAGIIAGVIALGLVSLVKRAIRAISKRRA